MKALLQRVTTASVSVDDEVIAAIGPGLLVLVCTEAGDGDAEVDYFARKIAHMRLFADAGGKTNLSLLDVGGQVLVISQFTLAADWRRGNRPSFSGAADPEIAERVYDDLCRRLAGHGVAVERGRFRSHMQVALVNDGPVTIWMDSQKS